MSDFDRRWRRLLAASRRTPSVNPPPPSPALVERLARRGLEARAAPDRRGWTRPSEPWAWASLLSFAAAGLLLLAWLRPPLQHEAAAMAEALLRLPEHVPAAPAVPAPFRLPPAPEALALLPDGPELRSALGLPLSPEATP